MEKYILTGGPCVGKTTLLDALAAKGYSVVNEAARAVIDEEQKKEGGIFPWTNLAGFESLVVKKQVDLETSINNYPVFLDRSMVDNIAYCHNGNIDVPEGINDIIRAAEYTRVFFLDQLPFFVTDKERKESKEEADMIHNKIYDVYDKLGFDIVRVPVCDSKEARLQFVLDNINVPDKNTEIEAKFKIDNVKSIRNNLNNYTFADSNITNEYNSIHDAFNILGSLGFMFRLRENGRRYITFKGKNKGSKYANNRLELEKEIPSAVYLGLKKIFPLKSSYQKIRESYFPLGDASCTICLDNVIGKGFFVEIEASSENQVKLWKSRLGITSDLITQPYYKL